MKRRRFVQSIPFLYASPALFAQAIAAPPALFAQEVAAIDTSSPGTAGKPVPRFFTAPQLGARHRLSEIMLPAINRAPGAVEAGAPGFLDFLVGQSPMPVRLFYRSGLDAHKLAVETSPAP